MRVKYVKYCSVKNKHLSKKYVLCKCKGVKGTNTPTWECICTVTWVYNNTITGTDQTGPDRPDHTGPDQTDRQTHFKSFLSSDDGRDDRVRTIDYLP